MHADLARMPDATFTAVFFDRKSIALKGVAHV